LQIQGFFPNYTYPVSFTEAFGDLLPLEKMTKNDQARVLDVYMYSSGHMGLEKNMGNWPNIDTLLNSTIKQFCHIFIHIKVDVFT
jgi:hypothetical protein